MLPTCWDAFERPGDIAVYIRRDYGKLIRREVRVVYWELGEEWL
jgi:hypothetical protein